MGKTATNISVVLGLVTIAFGGYYLYTEYSKSIPDFKANDQTMLNMLNNADLFVKRGKILEKTAIDTDFLDGEYFRSLQSFSTPVQVRPTGRPDPFAEVNPRITGSNF